MNITVDIQSATESGDSPEPEPIRLWIKKTLEHSRVTPLLPSECISFEKDIELSLRIVDREESRELNHQYRQKDKPTNVLSFPSELPKGLPFVHLGDLVVCAPVVSEEAQEQQKELYDHWAHMLIHGTLHLMGFDHIKDDEAEIMEALEVDILSTLNIADPY
jgi:probable rRNA maturation factor